MPIQDIATKRREGINHVVPLRGKGYGIIGGLLLSTNMSHRERLKELLRQKSLVRGTITLASGRVSNYYLDCKLTTLDPEGAALTGYTILDLLDSHHIEADAIGGPTIGADPIVAAVAAVSYLQSKLEGKGKPLPAFLVRKERKGHGRQKLIEGQDLQRGSKVVIVDEVCTTGQSTQEALTAVETAGLQVVAVVSLVDREEGGSDKLREKYPYYPVFTSKELLQTEAESAPESQKAEGHLMRPAAVDARSA